MIKNLESLKKEIRFIKLEHNKLQCWNKYIFVQNNVYKSL